MCPVVKVELEASGDDMGNGSGGVQSSVCIPHRDCMFKGFLFQTKAFDGLFVDARDGTP